jgi:hypothetical protein
MCHDRIDGDEIQLNHECIGRMLGVRRATVTDTLHVLEGGGAIGSSRGRIWVRDRALLEACAGPSYGFAETQYRKLIAPFGKGAAAALIPKSSCRTLPKQHLEGRPAAPGDLQASS